MISTQALRRRIDYQILRWQARLDASWADRVIPWGAAAALFALLAAIAVARARTFDTGNDLAVWVQGAWLITEGKTPEITVIGRHLLEPQFSVGFYLLAQITRVVATVPALLLIQALAIALGLPAVWQLCRQTCSLRVGAAMAAVLAYAAYPPLHQLNLADFHPEAVALPALLWAGHFSFLGRWRWAVPLFVVAVSLRSDLGLTVAAVGAVLALSNRARGGRRLMAAGILWALIAQLVIQPRIGTGGFVHTGLFAEYGDSIWGAVWGMLRRPLEVIGDLTARENFAVLASLLLPVAFLPVLKPRRLLPFAPILALVFLANVSVGGGAGTQHLIPAIVGIFLTLPFALEHLGRRNIERVTVDPRLIGGLVLATGVFFLLDSPVSPYAKPWEWGARDVVDLARRDVRDMIPSDARVRAAPTMIAELAERKVIRPVPVDAPPSAAALAAGVDVLVLDSELEELWDQPGRISELRSELWDRNFDVVYEDHGMALYRRASP